MQRIQYIISTLLLTLAFGFGAVATAQDISALKNHDTEAPLTFKADDARLKHKEGRGFLKGNVSITQGDLQMTADEMIVLFDNEGGFDNPTIHRLDAKGGVKVVSTTETVTAEWGVYDVNRRLVTLGGTVNYQRNGASIKGERLELDLVSGSVKLDGETSGDGRVSGSFSIPKSDQD